MKQFNPQKCEECLFLEIISSRNCGITFYCRYYNKGSFKKPVPKHDFCRVEEIRVIESEN